MSPARYEAAAPFLRCVPYTLSTVAIRSIEEVARGAHGQLWNQLYVLKDRGYMRNALERARAAGMRTVVLPRQLNIAWPDRRRLRAVPDTGHGALDGLGVTDDPDLSGLFQLALPPERCNNRRISSYSSRRTLVLMSCRASSNTSGK